MRFLSYPVPEVVSISKWWKSNLKSSCSKTAFLSQSQAVNFQTVFHKSLVRICRIHVMFVMYFCCQGEGCLHWPRDCTISFATRPVPKEMVVTLQQKSSRKTSKGLYRKSYDYIKAYSPAYDLIREQYWRSKTDYG